MKGISNSGKIIAIGLLTAAIAACSKSEDSTPTNQTAATTPSTSKTTQGEKSLSDLILPVNACSLLISQGLTDSVMDWQTAAQSDGSPPDMAYSCSSQTPTNDDAQINENGKLANFIEGSISGSEDRVNGIWLDESLHYGNGNNNDIQVSFLKVVGSVYKVIMSRPLPHKVADAIAHKKNLNIKVNGVPIKVQYKKWGSGHGYEVDLIIGKNVNA